MFMAFIKKFLIVDLHSPSFFRTVYLVNLLFCSVCFWDAAAIAANALLLLWSLPILGDTFLLKKGFRHVKWASLLLFFLITGFSTALLHVGSHFDMNFIMLYHAAVCFFLFYGIQAEPNREKKRAEMERTLKAVVYLTTALAAAGLLIVLLAPRGRLSLGDYPLGIMDNRFTGVYTNPNLAAFASVVGMICCHAMLKAGKNSSVSKRVFPRWMIILCFILNGISLFLSDSNSSLILAVVYLCVYLACRFYQKSTGSITAKTILRAAALAVCFVLIAVSSLAMRTVCQTAVANYVNFADQIRGEGQLVSFADYWNHWMNPSEPFDPETKTEIGRTQDYEISSGRLDSLKKSMVLFQKFPLLGVGKGNILDYGKKYLSNGFAFHDLHNGYLTILISDGLVGLAIFLAFIFLFVQKLFRFLRRNRNSVPKELPSFIAFLAAYCVFGLSEKAVLFDITFMVVIFWAFLGYTASLIFDGEEQKTASVGHPALRPNSSYPSGALWTASVSNQTQNVVLHIKDTPCPAAIQFKKIQYQQGPSPPHSRHAEQKARALRAASSSFPS